MSIVLPFDEIGPVALVVLFMVQNSLHFVHIVSKVAQSVHNWLVWVWYLSPLVVWFQKGRMKYRVDVVESRKVYLERSGPNGLRYSSWSQVFPIEFFLRPY